MIETTTTATSDNHTTGDQRQSLADILAEALGQGARPTPLVPRRHPIIEADRATQLENCAVWHMGEFERAVSNRDNRRAEHHDMLAFRLFQQARTLRAEDAMP